MKKYESIKVYISEDGKIETSGFDPDGAPVSFNSEIYNLRDRTKLLMEVLEDGTVYLTYKDNYFILENKEMEQVCGLYRNLKIKDTQNEKS